MYPKNHITLKKTYLLGSRLRLNQHGLKFQKSIPKAHPSENQRAAKSIIRISLTSPQHVYTLLTENTLFCKKFMIRLFHLGFVAAMLGQCAFAEDKDVKVARYKDLVDDEFHARFLDAMDAGKLDPPENIIPEAFRNDARKRMYFQAGFIRGVRSYQMNDGLTRGDGTRCMKLRDIFEWELDGFIEGCKFAEKVGESIQIELNHVLNEELQKEGVTPDTAFDTAISEIERSRVERLRAEQAGAGQPATKPADKPAVKDQPSTPTSKDGPR
jgi:hypothetical protein